MNKTISVTGKDGKQYTINTNHIVFYESVSKAFFNHEEYSWETAEEGCVIHLTNNFNPINTTFSMSTLDKLLSNQ